MNNPHYIVKAKIIKGKIDGEHIFETFERTYSNDILIIARNEAITFFNDMKKIIAESIDSEEELKNKFIDENSFYELELNGNKRIIRHHLNTGLSFIFRVNNEDYTLIQEGDFSGNVWDDMYYAHFEEYEYYKTNSIQTENLETIIYYCQGEWEDGFTEDEPSTTTILSSPVDWSGKSEELWWNVERKREIVSEISNVLTIEDAINFGETKITEFKPTLVYNFKTKKGGIGIKHIIAKSIAAFLNTNGGYLFIGVQDDKSISGLEYDFSLAGEKEPHDFFRLEFDEIINRFFSSSIHSKISTEFFTIEEKEIFVIKVEQSDRPIFIKNLEADEFWIRGEASTRKLIDIKEIIEHCFHSWSKKE